MEDFEKVDEVINYLKEQVKGGVILSPETWVRGAQILNILSTSETDKLFELQQVVAKKKLNYIENADYSVSKAKAKVEATDEYKEMMKQKAKIDNITETIRLAKIQARMVNDGINNQ